MTQPSIIDIARKHQPQTIPPDNRDGSSMQITITLSPGKRSTLTLDPLVSSFLPNNGEGSNQAYIKTCLTDFHQSIFPHMRLTLGEMVEDITQKFNVTQTNALTVAIIWHTGKHSSTAQIF